MIHARVLESIFQSSDLVLASDLELSEERLNRMALATLAREQLA